jgi:hypothetical protein
LRNWFVETTSATGAGGYRSNLIAGRRSRNQAREFLGRRRRPEEA